MRLSRVFLTQGSPTCEVLGVPQRQWLQQQLSSSDAALHIVASGSVLLGGVGSVGPQVWECGREVWTGSVWGGEGVERKV